MKKIFFFVVISMMILIPNAQVSAQDVSSKSKNSSKDASLREARPTPDFSKGILTEEILWTFGRVSAPEVSPDGTTLLYGVTYYNYKKKYHYYSCSRKCSIWNYY